MSGENKITERKTLTDVDRLAMLADGSFAEAYAHMLEFGKMMLSRNGLYSIMMEDVGSLSGCIVCFDFSDKQIAGLSAVPLTPNMDVKETLHSLLDKFAMVGHIFEAVEKPHAPSSQDDSKGKDVLIIAIYTKDIIGIAKSVIDIENSTIIRGEMVYPKNQMEKMGVAKTHLH